jgi:hypothetical protein
MKELKIKSTGDLELCFCDNDLTIKIDNIFEVRHLNFFYTNLHDWTLKGYLECFSASAKMDFNHQIFLCGKYEPVCKDWFLVITVNISDHMENLFETILNKENVEKIYSYLKRLNKPPKEE